MTGNKHFDSRQMFKHACAFVDCALFCEREPQNIKTGVLTHTVADIVNSSFACEVFIKSLLVFHDIPIKELKGHELKALWEKFKTVDAVSASLVEEKIIEIFNSNNELMFEEFLENISNAFGYWRYIYEKDGGKIQINFLRIFREALREICCEKFYKMSWNEFISRE